MWNLKMRNLGYMGDVVYYICTAVFLNVLAAWVILELTHCGLVWPYGDIDLHGSTVIQVKDCWWRHQAIIWTNVVFLSKMFCGIYPRAISQRVTSYYVCIMILKTILLKLLLLFPWNELTEISQGALHDQKNNWWSHFCEIFLTSIWSIYWRLYTHVTMIPEPCTAKTISTPFWEHLINTWRMHKHTLR